MPRLLIVTFLALVSGWASTAQAARRALLVGIDRYDNLGSDSQLHRAVNDARSVAKVLRQMGFLIQLGENATPAQFNALWQAMIEQVQPGDTVALFFSGHGVEIDGQNFLLPSDVPNIRFGRQEQLRREGLSLSEFLLDLRARKPQISLVVLDACRNNPFATPEMRSVGVGAGLAGIKDPPEGMFIMYSAGAGETALDRLPGKDPDPVNSVFTRKLVPLMAKPGLSLPEMAQSLRSEVRDLAGSVGHVQRPAYYDGLIGRFCLAACETPDRGAGDRLAESRADDSAWATAKSAGNAAAFAKYIELHPRGRWVAEAHAHLEDIKTREKLALAQQKEHEAQEAERRRKAEADDVRKREESERVTNDALAWAKATAANRLEGYRTYLKDWAAGRGAAEAARRIADLERLEQAWRALSASRNLPLLEAFSKEAVQTEFGPAADIRLTELRALEAHAWREARQQERLSQYEAFLTEWSEGFHAAAAREKVAVLRAIGVEWERLKSSDDEKRLEDFIHQHGWSEFGASAAARLVALRRERALPESDDLKTLTAKELLGLTDGAVIRFEKTGETFRFETASMPPYRPLLGRNFLKDMMKQEVVAGEGAFKALAKLEGRGTAIEGLGAVVESRVDKTGSLFLMQMHGQERARRDVEQADRQFLTMQLVRDKIGHVCIATQWHWLRAKSAPEKRSERCVIERQQAGGRN